jgi:hypothetical protein
MISLFGITDPAICLGYILSVVLALACIVYGLLNWNREGAQDGS